MVIRTSLKPTVRTGVYLARRMPAESGAHGPSVPVDPKALGALEEGSARHRMRDFLR